MQSFRHPFPHLTGTLHLRNNGGGDLLLKDLPVEDLCSYGLGKRRQSQPSRSNASEAPLLALANHPELRALAMDASQRALGCELRSEALSFHARRCIDDCDYHLSPHQDCPKTICALLIYLWNGQRGTSLYRLKEHLETIPTGHGTLLERRNNFTGLAEYQAHDLDVISTIQPGCFAHFEHSKTIQPRCGTFLLIPNARFRGALPDLPPSHHGVCSRISQQDRGEPRDLILIDVKLSSPPPPTLRSLLKSRLSSRFRRQG